jgi:alanine-synthesizing transaminase
MLSRRAHWSAPVNRLTQARQSRVHRGERLLDLTVSNPTRAGIRYPEEELSAAFARAARQPYDPEPLGLASARKHVAGLLRCDPEDVVLTASTSEAYSFLFKLLTDPGDSIATAVPSYPLLEHLAQLELVRLKTFPLEFHRRWEITPESVTAAIDSTTRAIVVVSPNNPTGSFVTNAELAMLASHGLPIIIDEVFNEYHHESTSENSACPPEVFSFSMGGLSKSAGLPHFKLGWIRIGGPTEARRKAIEGLELIADNFLSVSTPVQSALPELLRLGVGIRAAIHDRTLTNLRVLREKLHKVRAIEGLPVEGGWSAVLRVPRTDTDEELALRLIDRGVLVQPGYFFDFASDGYLVVSLLTPEEDFRIGVDIMIDEVTR